MPMFVLRATPSGSLHLLPPDALDTVLSSLDHGALVHLHIATAASLQTIKLRLSATRCACHWLKLSKRLPEALKLPPADSNAGQWHYPSSAAAHSFLHPNDSTADDTSESREDSLPDDRLRHAMLWSSTAQSLPSDMNASRSLSPSGLCDGQGRTSFAGALLQSASTASVERQGTASSARSQSPVELSASPGDPYKFPSATPLFGTGSSSSSEDQSRSSSVKPLSFQSPSARSEDQGCFERRRCMSSAARQRLLDDLAARRLAKKYRQLERQTDWRPCSKHVLLGVVRNQVQHINDIAALMHYCTKCTNNDWHCQLDDLGFDDDKNECSCMDKLVDEINQAFLIGYEKFLDFDDNKDDVDNVWKEFVAFDKREIQYHIEDADQLAFLCSLYRLQQLPSQAVLARFHSMLTRCSRYDLIVLSQVLQLSDRSENFNDKHLASHYDRDVPATDILTAYGQNEPVVRGAVSSLTEAQRCSMILCIKEMVDGFVACNTV